MYYLFNNVVTTVNIRVIILSYMCMGVIMLNELE